MGTIAEKNVQDGYEKVFINCSNHPSKRWSEEQKKAAEEYGRIVDIRFPEVDPAWTAEQVKTEADRICREIDKYCVGAVKKKGITVLAACSRRRTEEILNDDGTIQKKVIFSFEGFREF